MGGLQRPGAQALARRRREDTEDFARQRRAAGSEDAAGQALGLK